MARFLPERPDPGKAIEPYQAGKQCGCKPYPCRSFWDCSPKCAACQANGGPLFWEEEARSLPKETTDALRKLSGSHGSSGYKAKEQARGAA